MIRIRISTIAASLGVASLPLILTVLSGCQGVYEGMRMQTIERCYALPYPEQQDCLRENDVSYERYEQERKRQEPDNTVPLPPLADSSPSEND